MRFDIYVYSDLGMVEDCKIQLFTVAILYSKCFIYNIYCNFKDLKRLSMASYENDTHYYQKSNNSGLACNEAVLQNYQAEVQW